MIEQDLIRLKNMIDHVLRDMQELQTKAIELEGEVDDIKQTVVITVLVGLVTLVGYAIFEWITKS